MDIYLRLTLVILSCYRIAQLISVDNGPFDIFLKMRIKLGKMAAGSVIAKNFADLYSCPYCLGVWVSLGVFPAVIFPSLVSDLFILIWGIAGGQAFLQSISENNRGS
jgi:hypothetical protein